MKAISLLVVFALASGIANADTGSQKRARALNRAGMTKYELGEYDDAVRFFKQAYETHPDAKVLFNLAQAYRKKRDYQLALDSYRAYLRNLPDAANRAIVAERIAELERILAAQKASDEKPPDGVSAMPAPEPTVPLPTSIDPVAPPESPTPRAPPGRWYQDPWGWALIGGGVLAGSVGIGFRLHASGLEDDLATAPESKRKSLSDDISRDNAMGSIALVAGAALIVTGIVTLALMRPSARKHEPGVAFGPGWLVVRGKF